MVVKRPIVAILVWLIPAVILLVIVATVQMSTRAGVGGYDATADWLAVNAALDGRDPGLPLGELGDSYRFDQPVIAGRIEAIHPRTPAGLVLLSPVALLPGEFAYPVSLIGISIATMVLLAWVAIAFRLSRREVVIGSLLVVGSGYLYGALEFGAVSALIAVLVFAYWQSLRLSRVEAGGGLALGLAISFKIFPAVFLVLAVAQGRRKAMAWALGSTAVLGLVGLFWFEGTSIIGSLHTLSLAAQQWIPSDGNISLAGLLASAGVTSSTASVVSLGIGALWVSFCWRRGDDLDRVMTILTVAILVCWPLVWGHYLFLGLPAVAYLWKTGQASARRLVLVWLVAWVVRPAVWLSIEVAPVLSRVSAIVIQLLLVAAVHATRSHSAVTSEPLKISLVNQALTAD